MEIVLKNIGYQYKNKKILEKINLKIGPGKITGITGNNKTLLVEMINCLTVPNYGEIKIGQEIVTQQNRIEMRKKVCLVRQCPQEQFFTDTVQEEMIFLVNRLGYQNENIAQKMLESLKLVGLSPKYLEKNLFKLSSGEQKLVQIAISLLYSPQIIIFDEPFVELDYTNKKKLTNLIKMLKDHYHKTIIISSNDSNLLYELTDDLVILKDSKIIAADSTEKIYQDIKFLLYNEIDIPNLVLFTHKAKQKKAKISYHRDLRDLIKDVYKHV